MCHLCGESDYLFYQHGLIRSANEKTRVMQKTGNTSLKQQDRNRWQQNKLRWVSASEWKMRNSHYLITCPVPEKRKKKIMIFNFVPVNLLDALSCPRCLLWPVSKFILIYHCLFFHETYLPPVSFSSHWRFTWPEWPDISDSKTWAICEPSTKVLLLVNGHGC